MAKEYCVNCSNSAEDFETIYFESFDKYWDAVRRAKVLCEKYPAVDVECAKETDQTSYSIVFKERYEKGKKLWRDDWE